MDDLMIKRDADLEMHDEALELSETELDEVAGGYFDWTVVNLAQININGGGAFVNQSNSATVVVY